jgi:hypothetical protein
MELKEAFQRSKEILQGNYGGEVCFVTQEPGIEGVVFVYKGFKDKAKAFAKAIEEARKKIDA